MIEKVNKLLDLCNTTSVCGELDLPQIVVIGSQSSGKTSVLENIVGRDFLPRGCGIVTRRPLILQLIYKKEAEEEYCEFSHAQGKFRDFEKVKVEILEETTRLLKSRNDVSHIPITLRLYSNKVLSLTLVDLPGLTKVPTGDQPKNICSRIEEMCRRFVSNRNAIILAVSSANIDISNSDALQLARAVDPAYERTVGVLTKIDIMDSGTDALHILSGKSVPLRLGFVPVINRSQTDIVSGKSIREALRQEKEFFEKHPSYNKISLSCGTPHLIKKLNSILHKHIKSCLPDLQIQIDRLLAESKAELKSLGCVDFTPKEFLFKAINDLSKRFNDILQGRSELSVTELCGGARINYTFHHHFSDFIARLEALKDVEDQQIRTLLYNSSGSSSTIFFTHVAFEKLVKKSINQLRPHSIKLVGIIFNELVKILHNICKDLHLHRFPLLCDRIVECLIALFKERSEVTHKLVEAFINWNAEYINTKNPEFERVAPQETPGEQKLNKHPFLEKPSQKITFDPIPPSMKISNTMTEQEAAEVKYIKIIVKRYFSIIKNIVIDQIPKAIMTELVISSDSEIQNRLFRDVYEQEDILNSIKESREIKQRRAFLENRVSALKRAYDIMFSI